MDELLGVRDPVPRRRRRRVARRPRRPHAEEFRDQHRIDVRLHHEAMGIDVDGAHRRGARPRRASAPSRSAFDQLHVATGARPTRPDLPGIDLDHVQGVQTLDDAKALLDHARTSRAAARSSWSAVATSAWRWPRPSSAGAPRSRSSRAATSSCARSTPTWPSGCLPPMQGHRASTCGSTRAVAGFEPGRSCSTDGDALDGRPRGARPRASPRTPSWRATPAPRSASSGALGGRPPAAHDPRGRVRGRRLLRVAPPRVAAAPSTSPSAPSPTSRAGWPASTSAAATPPSRASSAPPSPRCATLEVGRTGLTEREAAARRLRGRGGERRGHHHRRLPAGRRSR